MSIYDPHIKTSAFLKREKEEKEKKLEEIERLKVVSRIKKEVAAKKRSSKWTRDCENLIEIIKKEREISQTDLLAHSNLSIWVFNKYRPHLIEHYKHLISFNKKEKKFSFINNNSSSLSLFNENKKLYKSDKK